MENRFKTFSGFIFQFGQRKSVPETFEDELMRQCHSITLFCSFVGFFLWLPYLQVDALNHPEETLLPFLRLGATAGSFLGGVLLFTPFFKPEKRHGFLLVFMYAYLLIAVGVITGLSGADAPYMGGYCVVILGSIIAPLPKKYSLPLIYTSALVFFSICFFKGIRFETSSELYSLTDLIVILGVTTGFTFILNRLRYKNYIKARQTADYAERLDKAIVEVKTSHENMLSSLRYASLIQVSMLPSPDKADSWFKDSFILWEPREIVGGDFYYIDEIDDHLVIAVVDCTGHGVPGALMTMLASAELKRIVRGEKCLNPPDILNQLNFRIKAALQQDTTKSLSDDGLDIGICVVKPNKNRLLFAGARLSLVYTADNEIHTIKGDRQSIGYISTKKAKPFSGHSILLEPHMNCYLYTDGITDQPGEISGKRFGTKALKQFLHDHGNLPFSTQKEELSATIANHQGEKPSVDDLTIIGFRLATDDKKYLTL